MKIENIQKLIVKYITCSISSTELDELDIFLQNPDNENHFRDFVKLNYFIDYNMKDYNTGESKKLLLNEIRKDKSILVRNRLRKVFKYAAVAIFFLASGYILKQELFNKDIHQTLVPKKSFVTLELDNGNIKVISEDGSSVVKDAKGNILGNQVGNKMVYDNNTQIEKLVYNTLNVPYGKQFKLELSDNTIVYLNAGSSIKYPVKFLEVGERKVFLKGEAFLEVSEDKEHPFIVNSGDINIRVLGTKFNISAYPDDKIKEVVLVTGSVELYDENQKSESTLTTVLKPGMKGNFDSEQNTIATETVVTSIYTSWVDGELVFRNITFEEILKKLERRFDVTIINENKKLAKVEFNASFSNMPVGQIMEYFRSVYHIDFNVDHNKIIIK